jgi:hypothetical protein
LMRVKSRVYACKELCTCLSICLSVYVFMCALPF